MESLIPHLKEASPWVLLAASWALQAKWFLQSLKAGELHTDAEFKDMKAQRDKAVDRGNLYLDLLIKGTHVAEALAVKVLPPPETPPPGGD